MLLSAKNQLKLDIVHKVECKKIESKEAQLILGVSSRTMRRYLKKYREVGLLFLEHGNRRKIPINRSPDELKKKVQKLVREKFFDFNMLHCLEKLESEHGLKIKRETFRKWCHEIGCVKRPKRKRARPRFKRDRTERPGLLIQMDGSHHRWFGDQKSCLVAVIDDATNEVPFAEFFESESTIACLKVLKRLIQEKGAFSILYVDRAGVYGGIKRSGFSQLQRALEELGIQVIYAYSPEAKGRIERLFSTLQDRLIPEMRLHGITTFKQANQYLEKIHLPEHNRRFSFQSEQPDSAYRRLPTIDLDEVFCIKEYRKISRDHTLSLKTERYRIVSPLKHSIYRQRVELRTYPDGRRRAFLAGTEIQLSKVRVQRRAA